MRYPFTELAQKKKHPLHIGDCVPGKFYRCVREAMHTTKGKVYMCVQYHNGYAETTGIVGDNFLVYNYGDCRFEEVSE